MCHAPPMCQALPVTWRQIDRSELLQVSGHDPFVRWVTTSEVLAVADEDRQGWACVGPWRPGNRHWGGAAIVTQGVARQAESEALELLNELAQTRGVGLEWFSTAVGRSLQLPSDQHSTGSGEWDFMWADRLAGEQPAGERVDMVELDDQDDAEELASFGSTHNANFEGFPGRGFATLWLGVRAAPGELRAIGALHELASGIPHVSGIVVAPSHRGQGLGMALTRELTRRAIIEAGVSTLGVYSDNEHALRIYQTLGYERAHRFHTRSLAPLAKKA